MLLHLLSAFEEAYHTLMFNFITITVCPFTVQFYYIYGVSVNNSALLHLQYVHLQFSFITFTVCPFTVQLYYIYGVSIYSSVLLHYSNHFEHAGGGRFRFSHRRWQAKCIEFWRGNHTPWMESKTIYNVQTGGCLVCCIEQPATILKDNIYKFLRGQNSNYLW